MNRKMNKVRKKKKKSRGLWCTLPKNRKFRKFIFLRNGPK